MTPTPEKRTSGDWKPLALLAVPVACCGLPLAIAAIATAGALAVGAGIAVTALLAVCLTIMVVARNRRRCASKETCTTTQTAGNRSDSR